MSIKKIDKSMAWLAEHYIITFIFSIAFILLIFRFLPTFFVHQGKSLGLDSDSGPVGDTIGGTIGPFIAIIASILTFLAFYIQYKANQQQKHDLQKERFENKFFEMLRLHKDNIGEMVIEGYDAVIKKSETIPVGPNANHSKQEVIEPITKLTSGRKVFVTAYTELVAIYKLCRYALAEKNIVDKERYLIKMSYILLFNGAGSDAVKKIDDKVTDDKEYVALCKEFLIKARINHEKSHSLQNEILIGSPPEKVELYFKYKPFSGHSSRFSHYYRHLYMMVQYVVSQPIELITLAEKKDYLRIVRAQLSEQEQVMLYYNYLSGYGWKWENGINKFFSEFRMIHNLPLEKTEFSIKPHDEFKEQIAWIFKQEGKRLFEYDE